MDCDSIMILSDKNNENPVSSDDKEPLLWVSFTIDKKGSGSMICFHCGKKISPENTKCPYCGFEPGLPDPYYYVPVHFHAGNQNETEIIPPSKPETYRENWNQGHIESEATNKSGFLTGGNSFIGEIRKETHGGSCLQKRMLPIVIIAMIILIISAIAVFLFFRNSLTKSSPEMTKITETQNIIINETEVPDNNENIEGTSANLPGTETSYQILFDMNVPGLYAGQDEIIPPEWLSEPGDQKLILPEVQLDGYDFRGWNTDINGKGIWYMPGDPFPELMSDMTLYAQWVKIIIQDDNENTAGFCLIFDMNLPETEQELTIIDWPEPIVADGETPIYLPVVQIDGYEFLGWNSEADGSGEQFSAGERFFELTNNVTLFAQWSRIDDYSEENTLI